MPPLRLSVTASIPGKATTTLLWHTTAVSATVHLLWRLVPGACHMLLTLSTRQLTALVSRTIVAANVPAYLPYPRGATGLPAAALQPSAVGAGNLYAGQHEPGAAGSRRGPWRLPV